MYAMRLEIHVNQLMKFAQLLTCVLSLPHLSMYMLQILSLDRVFIFLILVHYLSLYIIIYYLFLFMIILHITKSFHATDNAILICKT